MADCAAPVADGAICPNCAGTAAGDAPTPIIGAISNPQWLSLPLVQLLGALEDHTRRLARLAPTTPIPIPAGVPDRLLVPIGCVVPGRYQPRTVFDQAALDADVGADVGASGDTQAGGAAGIWRQSEE